MSSFAFFLGLHHLHYDLTFAEVLLLAVVAALIKTLVDGDLWPLVRGLFMLLWHVVLWAVDGMVSRYRYWSMKRMLMRHRTKMIGQRDVLRQNIDRLSVMMHDLNEDRSVHVHRTVARLKTLDGLLGQKAEQMGDIISRMNGSH